MSFTLITTSEQLTSCLSHLSQQKEIAIDLEFDKNRYRYGFNLCLMQVFTDGECYLIDPLSKELDITYIFPLLENPDIQKISFSFSEDIRLLHHIGCTPKGIYDLSFALSLLDYQPTSLANYLMDILRVDVGKSSQQSNWFNRPLSEDQLAYAASDVLHLFELKKALDIQLEEKGITEWVNQENNAFESADYGDENHNEVLKEKYKNGFNQIEWHVFSGLMLFRDDLAKELDRPPFHVVDRAFLQELVKDHSSIRSWTSRSSIHKKVRNESVRNKVNDILHQKTEEAKELNLSKRKKASQRLSQEEYQQYKRIQQNISEAKNNFFKPIQKLIEHDYGKNARAFILSNRLIGELVGGHFSNFLPYKQELIEQYSRKLDLPYDKYITH